MFKVNNRDTRTRPSSGAFIVNFRQVNAGGEDTKKRYKNQPFSLFLEGFKKG